MTAADVQQLSNYIAGLSQLQAAGGPLEPIPATVLEQDSGVLPDETTLRAFRVAGATASAGERVIVSIELDSEGDEVVASFTLNFDPAILSNPIAEPGADSPAGAILIPNTTAAARGALGILLDSGSAIADAGRTSRLITVTFDVNPDAATGPTHLEFSDAVIGRETANALAQPLATKYRDGTIYLVDRNSNRKSLSGRVMTADGQGIRNAEVVITGSGSAEPIVRVTAPSGYYHVENLDNGATYVISARAGRFRFAVPAMVFTLNQSIWDADFTAEPLLRKSDP